VKEGERGSYFALRRKKRLCPAANRLPKIPPEQWENAYRWPELMLPKKANQAVASGKNQGLVIIIFRRSEGGGGRGGGGGGLGEETFSGGRKREKIPSGTHLTDCRGTVFAPLGRINSRQGVFGTERDPFPIEKSPNLSEKAQEKKGIARKESHRIQKCKNTEHPFPHSGRKSGSCP